jgi:hypothetical protein
MPGILVISLFGIMLLTMLTRVLLPFGQKPEGSVVLQVSLPFRQRLLYHRTSIYLIGTVMVLGGIGGWLSFAYQIIIVLAAFAIVGLKIRYIFTVEGVALNNVVFRRWDEFQEIKGDHRQLELSANKNLRPFKILLPPLQAEEVGKLVTRMINGSFKAEVASVPTKPNGTGRPAKRRKAAS